jgi:hypothetical protein
VIYLNLLLGQTIVNRLGVPRPDDHHVIDLVRDASLCLASMGKFTEHDATLVIREMFTSTPIEQAPKGIFFVMYASIMLGVLCHDPANELPTLRPWLIRKCAALLSREPGRFEYLRPPP